MNNLYEKHKNTENWAVIWQSIDELVENNDLEELTPRGHIVGYICEKLEKEAQKK